MGNTSVSRQVGLYAMTINKSQGQTLEKVGAWFLLHYLVMVNSMLLHPEQAHAVLSCLQSCHTSLMIPLLL
jgi:hypothetical protein